MAIKNRSALATRLIATALALGWSLREAQWARTRGKQLPNTLVT